jgi:exopolysaccharide biosynthesis polyprenyl glycosylphosphotransferase
VALLAGDAVCVTAALLISYWYRYDSHLDKIPIPGGEVPTFSAYVGAVPVLIVVVVLSLAVNRGYSQTRGRGFVDEAYGLIGGLFVGSILLLAAMSLYRAFSYSRLMVVYVAVVAAVLLIAYRLAMRVVLSQLRRRGLGTTRALVVGSGAGAEALIHRLEMFPEYGYELIGVIDDQLKAGDKYHRVPVIGGRNELAHLVMRHSVDEVFMALPPGDNRELLRLIDVIADTTADIKILPGLLDIMASGVVADDIDGIPLVGVRRSRLVGGNLLVKRAFDLVLALLLLVPGIPLMAIIAIAIRLDSPGPVIYRQERVGKNERTFTAYKFRSMKQDAEADTGPVFTSRDDPRITKVGRFLRRTSFDEVPQVINVLRGEMSLVGPRPERPHFVAQFEREVERYSQRHEVRPGITGWAQLNDLRQDTSIEQRTIYDTYYVDNWSLAFDLKILVTTFIRVFAHRNAY